MVDVAGEDCRSIPRPVVNGEIIGYVVDAATNVDEWAHVAASFSIKPTPNPGESIRDMVKRDIAHRKELVREMMVAIAEEQKNPVFAQDEVIKATYLYLVNNRPFDTVG